MAANRNSKSEPSPPDDRRHFAPRDIFEFDVTPSHQHDHMTVRWGAREVLRHDIPIPMAGSQYIAVLKYCLAGAGVLKVAGETLQITPHTVFWTSLRVSSLLTASRERGMTNYALFLSGSNVEDQVLRYLHAPFGAAQPRDPRKIQSIFDELMIEGRGESEFREETCAYLAEILLRRISAFAEVPLRTNALAHQTFNRCRQFIERNFTQCSTLREVADACDVTSAYLCRLFDQFYSASPYDYMTQLKLSRAASLLLRPGSPVREIAHAVGYADAKQFARNFKAFYGKNPTEYRTAVD